MICEAYGIILVYLPPNATHLFQPLDVAIFRSFKSVIKNNVTTYLRASNKDELPRSTAIAIAGRAFKKLNDQSLRQVSGGMFRNEFRTCGAWSLSLPAMLKRFEMQTTNCVENSLGTAAWIQTRQTVRETVLTVPARKSSKGRKRVAPDKDALNSSDSKPSRRCVKSRA
ncbi:hypothetical protein Ae201684P_012885 [Aphanomyces euteiches]|uniref:DDE-1 domain-containing protein n=1 Tax=Aphanomyces euteiches TaxID=100861 RepID=A0A6G0XGL2_9STRA|nr:hypothetical protein Ae201684_005128 [Aphanomyces euteiches]KAH9080745.1 hypothetical protein Ae201684P_012885 [Aphanomyces euteiches]